MRNDMSVEAIKARVKARIAEKMDLDTREGSFVDTAIGPLAVELADQDVSMDAAFSIAFPDESSGPFLDEEGWKIGVYRKAGVKATADIALTGTPNVTIPAGTAFLTADRLTFILTAAVTLRADGTGAGKVSAETVGSRFNVPAGEIVRTYTTVPGLTSFASGEAAGGVDDESDADYFARIDAHRKKPATSSNAHYYEQLALEVVGVGYAKAFPREFGPGTVGVMVAGTDKGPVDETVLSALQEKVLNEHLICDGVRGYSVQPFPVSVTCSLTLDGSVSLEQVKEAFSEALEQYMKGMPFSGNGRVIVYHQVAYLLLSVAGVVDYTTLLVNEGAVNIPIGEKEAPVLTEVMVT